MCPCPEERPFLSHLGNEVAEALFVAWRRVVGPTEVSDHLVVARLSAPIPDRAWAHAEDLLRASGLGPKLIAREALRVAGYPTPGER